MLSALHWRAEMLDPLGQMLHEGQQLRYGSGRAVDPLAGCFAAYHAWL
jgi:hypothetical protein